MAGKKNGAGKEHKSDEELFLSDEYQAFWTAKRLSPRRAVRFHHWLAGVMADVAQAVGSVNLNDLAATDWPAVISGLLGVLDEDSYFEILSIASGHTKEEIEANEDQFDYYAAWQCVADLIEINRLGDIITDFFTPIANLLTSKEEPENPPLN